MAEQIAFGAAEKVVESLIVRIWQEIQYVIRYNRNIKKLREKENDLENREGAIKLLIGEANRNAEIIGPDLLGWLEKVDRIKIEANDILERTKNASRGCFCCKCPNLLFRNELSKQAFMMTTELTQLHDASNFGRISYLPPPGQMPWTAPQEFVEFDSRMEIKNDIMQALKDDSITIIGICGMAGVGKSILVKAIADKVKTTDLFVEVTMAVVSKDLSVVNIQDKLAENLGLIIGNYTDTDHARAERLYTRLMNKEKRIFIILDDLWEELHLHNIGIPVAGKRKGLKVLLTSRYKEVCSAMGATIFEVEVLSNEDSWKLFKDIAKVPEEANDRKEVAKQMAKECGGLPLAIVTIAKALMNKADYEWREALQQLKEASVSSIRGVQNLLYSRIKWS